MKDFSKIVTEKIVAQSIEPIPKWHFMLKNIAIWTTFILAFLLGALSFGVLFNSCCGEESSFFLLSQNPLKEFLLDLLPIIWVFSLFLFSAIAIWGAKHTKKGYRWSWQKMLLINLIASLVFGIMFSVLGVSKNFDHLMKKIHSKHRTIEDRRTDFWNRDNNPRMGGIILEIQGNYWLVEDARRAENWKVDLSEIGIIKIKNPVIGDKVGIFGEKLPEKIIKAKRIVRLKNLRMPPRRTRGKR